jgi:hypothetical protein
MDPAKDSLINYFRQRMQELRIQYYDTLSSDTAFRDCHLVDPQIVLSHPPSLDQMRFEMSPNPTKDIMKLYSDSLETGSVYLMITNSLGQLFYQDIQDTGNGPFSKTS